MKVLKKRKSFLLEKSLLKTNKKKKHSSLTKIEALHDLDKLEEEDNKQSKYDYKKITTEQSLLDSARDLNVLATINECDGPFYIASNGEVLKVNKNWDSDYGSRIHTNFIYRLFDHMLDMKGLSYNQINKIETNKLLSHVEGNLGFIRANFGSSHTDRRSYITINYANRPTNAQYDKILEFVDKLYQANKSEVLVYIEDIVKTDEYNFTTTDFDSKIYVLAEHIPEDIIQKIKRGIATGNLVENLKEEYVDEDKKIYTTESVYEVVNIVKSSDKPLRILWDRNINRFFICDADELIHSYMFIKALKNGYYGDLEVWNVRNSVLSYLDDYGKNAIYYIYAPKGQEEDSYGSEVGQDGYEGKYVYSFGTMTTRSDDKYKASPLAKALGKYESHYVQKGWVGDSPKLVLVDSLNEENSGDGAIWKGKKFWIGAINSLDNQIEEVHSYKEAEANDFHHSFYFSDTAVEKINDEEWSVFWIEKGQIILHWRNWKNQVESKVISDIEKQITFLNKMNEDVQLEVDSQGNELSQKQSEFFKDSQVRDKNNRLLVVYHGTTKRFENEVFNSSINWFSSNPDYVRQFATLSRDNKEGGHDYLCYLNALNLFDCGLTDESIFVLAPITTPYTFSRRFKQIVDKLNIDDKILREVIDEVAKFYKQSNKGYAMKIHLLTRSNQFKELLVKQGYDGMRCIEQGNSVTFGIFNANQIKSIDNQEPTSSNNINK
jgi:hypothetical protein